MSTENEDWILIKPDDYLALPLSRFGDFIKHAKLLKPDWGNRSPWGDAYTVGNRSMALKLITAEQMTAIEVAGRLSQSEQT